MPRWWGRRRSQGRAPRRRRGQGAGGGTQAQLGAERAGRAEESAERAAAPEVVERSEVPGGGGAGGVQEEGGSPGGVPLAGARPGPATASPTLGPAAAVAMARPLVPSSQKALLLELKGLQEEPVEGFRVTLVDEGDLYNWEVAIFGPPNTFYEGGYFKVSLGPAPGPRRSLGGRPLPPSGPGPAAPLSGTGRPRFGSFPPPTRRTQRGLPRTSGPVGERGAGEGGSDSDPGVLAWPLARVPTKARMGPLAAGACLESCHPCR